MNEATCSPLTCDGCKRPVFCRTSLDNGKTWLCNDCLPLLQNSLETRVQALEEEVKELRQELANHRVLGI